MKIGVMLIEGPYQHQAADTAYYFVRAAQAKGHQIVGIFLFADGVQSANRFINPPGERNIGQRFEELAAGGIPIVACTACAKFRGLKPDIKSEHLKLSGLGALADYLREAERFVTFGD